MLQHGLFDEDEALQVQEHLLSLKGIKYAPVQKVIMCIMWQHTAAMVALDIGSAQLAGDCLHTIVPACMHLCCMLCICKLLTSTCEYQHIDLHDTSLTRCFCRPNANADPHA